MVRVDLKSPTSPNVAGNTGLHFTSSRLNKQAWPGVNLYNIYKNKITFKL